MKIIPKIIPKLGTKVYEKYQFNLSEGIPRTGLIFYAKAPGMVDTIGLSSREIKKKYHLLGDGIGYLASSAILGSETIISKDGTAAVTFASGRVNVGVGTLWSLVLDNGSRYEYPTMTSTTTAVMYDVSGNGRHLTLTSFTLATAVVESLTVGSDWLNQMGWSEYENLTSSYPSSSAQVNVAQTTRDKFLSLTKLTTGSFASVQFPCTTLRPTHRTAILSARVTLRKLPGVPGIVHLGWYDTSFNNTTITKLSGPGDTSLESGCPKVINLSETEDTVVYLTKNNFTVGGANHSLLVYPGGFSSTTIGHGCIIGNVQICDETALRDFTEKLNVPYCVQPASLRGHDSSRFRIACLGDSITYGYAPYLVGYLPSSLVVNAGVGGNTTTQLLARLTADVLDKSPQYCLLLAGINDINTDVPQATIISNITSIIDQLVGAGITPIVSTLLPYGNSGNWTSGRQSVLEAVNNFIAQYCSQQSIAILDSYNSVLGNGADLAAAYDSGDGLHPNAAGYRLLSLLFDALIPTVFTDGDAYGNSLKYPGRAKYSLLGVDGAYYWPSAPDIIAVTGVDNAVYNADGTGKEFATPPLALAAMATLADDTYLFAGTKAAALYSVDMSARANLIKRIVGVEIPSFVDTWNDAATWNDANIWSDGL